MCCRDARRSCDLWQTRYVAGTHAIHVITSRPDVLPGRVELIWQERFSSSGTSQSLCRAPPELFHAGRSQALHWLCDWWEELTGLACKFF